MQNCRLEECKSHFSLVWCRARSPLRDPLDAPLLPVARSELFSCFVEEILTSPKTDEK